MYIHFLKAVFFFQKFSKYMYTIERALCHSPNFFKTIFQSIKLNSIFAIQWTEIRSIVFHGV